MPTPSEAEEHLRVIRSLMERGTIYRAISAPTALTGGLVSLAVCGFLHFSFAPLAGRDVISVFRFWFLMLWMCALVITIAANTYFIRRGAKLRNEPFISPGMKFALVSLLPSFLCAGFFAFFFSQPPRFVFYFPYLSAIWMLFYGLGLLATAHFAPRSIAVLGWTFLLSGFVVFCVLNDMSTPVIRIGGGTGVVPDSVYTVSNLLMGLTFGLFHLIYAAFTWPRKTTVTNPGAEP